MAVVVCHLKNKKNYILLGMSYAYYKDTTPGFFGTMGMLFPNEEKGEFRVAALSDEKGEIFWAYTTDLRVISVDEFSPMEVIKKCSGTAYDKENSSQDVCPACGEKVESGEKECTSCGLTLFMEQSSEHDS